MIFKIRILRIHLKFKFNAIKTKQKTPPPVSVGCFVCILSISRNKKTQNADKGYVYTASKSDANPVFAHMWLIWFIMNV